jgi:hypothetical protein
MDARTGLARLALHGPSLRRRKQRSSEPSAATHEKAALLRHRVAPVIPLLANETHPKVRLLITARARTIEAQDEHGARPPNPEGR